MGLKKFQNFHPGIFFERKLFSSWNFTYFYTFFQKFGFHSQNYYNKNVSFQVPFVTSVVLDVIFKLATIVFWKVLFWWKYEKKCDFILTTISVFFILILSIFSYISLYLHNPFSIMRGLRELLFLQLVVLFQRRKRHSNSFWAHRMFEISSHKVSLISSIYKLKFG